MKVSVIVLAWNGLAYLEACLNSVFAQTYPNFEVLVVDNASTDGSAEFVVTNFKKAKLMRNERNLGFSGGMNAGTKVSCGDVVIWLNQDTIVQAGWLQELVAVFEQKDVGVAGCKIFEMDGKTLNHAGGALDVSAGESYHLGAGEADRGQYEQPADVAYVTGAAMAVRREVLEQVGLLDERFFPGYYEDADYCLRVQNAGYKVRYVPQATVIHHVSAATQNQWPRRRFYYYRNRLLFVLKHLSPEGFRRDFLISERDKLNNASLSELHAAQMALSDVLVRVEGQFAKDDLKALQDWVVLLRNKSTNLLAIQNALNENRSHKHGIVGAALPTLEVLNSAWRIEEPSFSSKLPILGPLVAAIRTVWNSVSTKWYVLGMFQQQMRFNQLTNNLMQAIVAYIWDNEVTSTLLEERYGQLKEQVMEQGISNHRKTDL